MLISGLVGCAWIGAYALSSCALSLESFKLKYFGLRSCCLQNSTCDRPDLSNSAKSWGQL